MSDNRWQRIEDIFHRAAELAPEARSAFLNQACGDDQSLRREVESLLAHESENGSTFVGATGDSAPESIAHYRIIGKLGQGGMGAVYRATDTKLDREVAIKVLPAVFAFDPDRMARFRREAKVLASLNHPNIAAIYGVEDRALIMELVEGKDLRGPLPVATALNYAGQIAAALDAAHERGIVHRDLKPANIRITPDGAVKVLDFGLAKATQSGVESEESPTVTATQAGVIMGTPAYMAPEQARGRAIDKRADIWAFGVVLFEMLTGKRPFDGESASDSLAAVLARSRTTRRRTCVAC
jgi:serine/threonine protein kinase